MGVLSVPDHLADQCADCHPFLLHGHSVNVFLEYSEQLPHEVKLHIAQSLMDGQTFQFADVGAQPGLLCVQFFNALFHMDSGGAAAEVGQ